MVTGEWLHVRGFSACISVNFDKLMMPDRIKQMTRRPKKRKGFCGNPSRSSTTSSDLDNSTVVEQHDEEHI